MYTWAKWQEISWGSTTTPVIVKSSNYYTIADPWLMCWKRSARESILFVCLDHPVGTCTVFQMLLQCQHVVLILCWIRTHHLCVSGQSPDSIFFYFFIFLFNAGIPGFCWCVQTCCGNLALAVWTGAYMQKCVFVKVCTCVYMCVCVHPGYESEYTRAKHGCLYCRVAQKSSWPYFPRTSPVINISLAEIHFPQVLFCSHDDLIFFFPFSCTTRPSRLSATL